jgi:hypothetical protein
MDIPELTFGFLSFTLSAKGEVALILTGPVAALLIALA